MGIDDVTFSVPDVIVNAPAIPRVELDDSCNDVPFILTSKRLARPLNVEVPVNVVVPPVAENVPLTTRLLVIVELTAVVTDPVINRLPKVFVPVPEIVVDEPLIVRTAPVVKLPVTERFPVSVSDAAVLTEPVIERFSSIKPGPLILAPAPVITTVPPAACSMEPAPLVERLPDTLITEAGRPTDGAVIFRLLKFCIPAPLIVLPGPVKLVVLLLPLKVPLFIQLPPILWVNVAALKVVDAPILTLPDMVIGAAAVYVTDVPEPILLERLPTIVSGVPANVFTAAPLELVRLRFPYV